MNININDFALLIKIYKGQDLVKEFYCPRFYLHDYIAWFLYEGSPYRMVLVMGGDQTYELDNTIVKQFPST